MLYGVIMAGGQGKRLWPVSRKQSPKQFIKIDIEGNNLLQQTYIRLRKVVGTQNVCIVTLREYTETVCEQIPDLGREKIFVEPAPRGTAACVGYAVANLIKGDLKTCLIAMPADHKVEPEEELTNTLLAGAKIAEKSNGMVVVGIKANRPCTELGYIRKGEQVDSVDGCKVYTVKRFHEKPGYDQAKKYVDSGDCLFNLGIFIVKGDAFMRQLQRYLPAHYQLFSRIIENRGQRQTTLEEEYQKLPSVSVDHGILEKSDDTLVVEGNFEWMDLGTWDAVFAGSRLEEHGNIIRGDFVGLDSRNIVAFAEGGIVAVVGVENLVVVHTPDATLVCDKRRVNDVRQLENLLRDKGLQKYL